MNNNKKTCVLILILCLIFLLTGCRDNTTTLKSTKHSTLTPTNSTTITNSTTTTALSLSSPLTDKESLYNIEQYYQKFDFNKLLTLGTNDLIEYVQDLILDAPGLLKYDYDDLRYLYDELDSDGKGGLILFYAQESHSATWDKGNTWNREHVFARSLGGFQKDDAAGYDMYNVRPTITSINSARDNKVFGNLDHNSSSVTKVSYNGKVVAWTNSSVFEPQDSVKGDVARIVFYVSTMYYKKYTNLELKQVLSDTTYKTILEWNAMDPVSEDEIKRNNVVQKKQGNRNIFVDYPELANYIWG